MGVRVKRLIKLLLISVLAFFVLLTLIGLLFPSQIQSVRALVVNKPLQKIAAEITINENWVKWYPFFYSDKGASITHAKGDTSYFLNDKKQLVLFNKENDSSKVSFMLQDWNGVTVKETIMALPIADDSTTTQVVWNETENLKWYPWERFRGLLLESSKGIFLDTTLNRFKRYVEATP
jgi:hypothetical protein